MLDALTLTLSRRAGEGRGGSGSYLIVPRSSMMLPCRCQELAVHWRTCSCMIGKWSLDVVVTLIPGSRNGLAFCPDSFSCDDAIFITFSRVKFEPACLSTSTIVYATATP